MANGPVKVAGICWATRMQAGKLAGSAERIFCTTGGPPVETPMTTISCEPVQGRMMLAAEDWELVAPVREDVLRRGREAVPLWRREDIVLPDRLLVTDDRPRLDVSPEGRAVPPAPDRPLPADEEDREELRPASRLVRV